MLRWATVALLATASTLGRADTVVSGTLSGNSGHSAGPFACIGVNPCSGVANITNVHAGCTNSPFSFSTDFSITGLDLSHPGMVSGTLTVALIEDHTNNPDGSCTYRLDSGGTWPYTGTWDGAQGTLNIAAVDTDGSLNPISGQFTATVSSPPFPLTVSGSVNATTANVSALVQPRAQDVGRPVGIFVFAWAPASLVAKRAGWPVFPVDPRDGDQCILAQVLPNGTLQGVSGASSLAATVTTTLNSQGQTVTLLNNVATPNVAGAAIYVGYGTNGSAMTSSGTYQVAVAVPGSTLCSSSPTNALSLGGSQSYEGLWLKGDESGWGINITQQGTTVFATWFTYDTDGTGMWLVMSGGTQTSPGNFTGTLYRTVGPAFSASPFNSISFPANYTTVGTLSFSFSSANSGTMSYTVNGVSQSKAITRFLYAATGTSCTLGGAQGSAPNYQDLWLRSADGSQESGWGINISHQGDVLFATWFTYLPGSGSTNKGMWLVMSNGNKVSNGVYSGSLQTTMGPAFSAMPFNPNAVSRNTVGTGTFTFSDANNGTFSYTVNGVTQSKPIARYIYASPSTVCQ